MEKYLDDKNYIVLEKYKIIPITNEALINRYLQEGYSVHPGSSNKFLNILTFNLGYNVINNELKGTEKGLVEKCQTKYASSKGWNKTYKLSQCSYNAASFVANYNLCGLQEMSPTYRNTFEKVVTDYASTLKFISYDYLLTVYDPHVLGEGISIYKGLIPLNGLNRRLIQAIWFEKLQLIFINLHLPHNIDIKKEVERSCKDIKSKISYRPQIVILLGDFNDFTGTLLDKGIQAFGYSLKLPFSEKILTCCEDSDYSYPGDYIFTNLSYYNYYGLPENYIRSSPLMSDHDPITLSI